MEDVTLAFQQRQLFLAERTAERQMKINVVRIGISFTKKTSFNCFFFFKKPPPYKKILSNKPVGKVRIQETSSDRASRCDCELNDQKSPCGSDSECLNRFDILKLFSIRS